MKYSQTNPKPAEPRAKQCSDLNSPKEQSLIALLYALSASLIPTLLFFAHDNTLSLLLSVGAIVCSIVTQVRLVGSFSGALGHVVLLLTLALLGGSPLLAALLGVLISSACAFAALCGRMPTPWLIPLPLVPYAISLLLTRSPLGAVSALLTLPCALVLVHCVKKERSRLSSICALSLAFGAAALGGGAVALWHTEGALSADLIRTWIDSVRLGVTEELVSSLDLLGEELGYLPDATQVSAMIDSLFNVLPALLIICCNLVGWLLHTAMLRVELERGLSKDSATKMLSFDMSMTSAIVYFLALFLSLALGADGVAFWGTVASNVYLVLVPGMLLTAWIAMNALLFGRAPSCLSFLLYLLILFFIFQFPTVMLPIAAAFGAGVVLVGRIRRYLADKQA